MKTIALIIFVLLPLPSFAWQASALGPVCTLSHQTDNGQVTVTYDPHADLPYAIELARRDVPWLGGPVFAMRFDGPGRLTITTDRHRLSDDNDRLTVTDKGFGNVLNGIEQNHVATAVLGDQTLVIPLAEAAPEVAKFRNCAAAPSV
jgi:hypothetical protein